MSVRKRLFRLVLIATFCLLPIGVHAGIFLSQGQVPVVELEGLCSSGNIDVDGTTITCLDGSFAIDERTISADESFELIASKDFDLSDSNTDVDVSSLDGEVSIDGSVVGGSVQAKKAIDISDSDIGRGVTSDDNGVSVAGSSVGGSVEAKNAIGSRRVQVRLQ